MGGTYESVKKSSHDHIHRDWCRNPQKRLELVLKARVDREGEDSPR